MKLCECVCACVSQWKGVKCVCSQYMGQTDTKIHTQYTHTHTWYSADVASPEIVIPRALGCTSNPPPTPVTFTPIMSPSWGFCEVTLADRIMWFESRSTNDSDSANNTGLSVPSVKLATPTPHISIRMLSLMSVILTNPVRTLLVNIPSVTWKVILLSGTWVGSGAELKYVTEERACSYAGIPALPVKRML